MMGMVDMQSQVFLGISTRVKCNKYTYDNLINL